MAADNVKLSGAVCDNSITLGSNVSRSSILIERCKADEISWSFTTSNKLLTDITILNCNISSKLQLGGSTAYASSIRNIYIVGNIIRNDNANSCVSIIGVADQISNVNIINNTIIGRFTSTGTSIIKTINSFIQDNIIINTANETFVMSFAQTGNIIRKNVFSLSQDNVTAYISENYPDNYYNGATLANTFTCQSNSKYRTEEYYLLKDDSPAKNAAYDGGDCGAFGGTTPYIICGRPQGVPYIYDVEVPAQPLLRVDWPYVIVDRAHDR
jgi:hypothetical protein